MKLVKDILKQETRRIKNKIFKVVNYIYLFSWSFSHALAYFMPILFLTKDSLYRFIFRSKRFFCGFILQICFIMATKKQTIPMSIPFLSQINIYARENFLCPHLYQRYHFGIQLNILDNAKIRKQNTCI